MNIAANEGFTEQQKKEFAEIIWSMIEPAVESEINCRAAASTLPRGSAGSLSEQDIAEGEGGGSMAFQPQNLGYFHLNLDTSYDTGDIVYHGWETLYWDIYTFTQCITNFVIIKDVLMIQGNIVSCLWGTALQWWLQTLSVDECDLYLTVRDEVKRFLQKIIAWFKMSTSMALSKLNKEWYIKKDVWDSRDS